MSKRKKFVIVFCALVILIIFAIPSGVLAEDLIIKGVRADIFSSPGGDEKVYIDTAVLQTIEKQVKLAVLKEANIRPKETREWELRQHAIQCIKINKGFVGTLNDGTKVFQAICTIVIDPAADPAEHGDES